MHFVMMLYPHACKVYEGKVERYKKTNYDGHCASYDGTIVMKVEKRKTKWKDAMSAKLNGRIL